MARTVAVITSADAATMWLRPRRANIAGFLQPG